MNHIKIAADSTMVTAPNEGVESLDPIPLFSRRLLRSELLPPGAQYPAGANVTQAVQDEKAERSITLRYFLNRHARLMGTYKPQVGRQRKYALGAQCTRCHHGQQVTRKLCFRCYHRWYKHTRPSRHSPSS